MKKLVYRDILGNNPRKREVSMEEISGRNQSKVSKKWICKYFIREKHTENSIDALKKWVTKRKKTCRKDRHILRQMNTETGENKIICKVLGEFFVIRGGSAYRIVYINEVKIQIECAENNRIRG
ncbi:MAG: hypothetical protein P9L88_00720 [Candidatus Tantalella remota]|nr:hypothetical protein [Candidatus Tantalella remota]